MVRPDFSVWTWCYLSHTCYTHMHARMHLSVCVHMSVCVRGWVGVDRLNQGPACTHKLQFSGIKYLFKDALLAPSTRSKFCSTLRLTVNNQSIWDLGCRTCNTWSDAHTYQSQSESLACSFPHWRSSTVLLKRLRFFFFPVTDICSCGQRSGPIPPAVDLWQCDYDQAVAVPTWLEQKPVRDGLLCTVYSRNFLSGI